MIGITAFASYVPASRLPAGAIPPNLRSAGGPGSRSVASYDEDTTTMGVEAARRVVGAGARPEGLLFATSRPAYLDKTNATVVHAALSLEPDVAAYDMVGSVRSGISAIRAAVDAAAQARPTLAVLSDIRTGLPGGVDEQTGGDAAAAFLLGTEGVLAEFVAAGASTAEFLDRWRLPEEASSHVWEERFGETVYLQLVDAAVADVCKRASMSLSEIDHVVVTGSHDRAVRRIPAVLDVGDRVVKNAAVAGLGNTGCAQAGVSLIAALERAKAGETILLISAADGVDALLFRATDLLAAHRGVPLERQISAGTRELDYSTFLIWRGELRREPPRRPDPDRPAAPPSFRHVAWKYGFTAGRCVACGTRHLPPGGTCLNCRAVEMTPEVMADVPAKIATFTVDRLAYSPSPPAVVAVVDFDGGGRFQCEMTDVAPEVVKIGLPVEMTFRKLYTVNSVHNYFWKAKPVLPGEGGSAS